MAKNAIYGVESFKMQKAAASGFPTSWTGSDVYEMKAIVKDSLSFNDSEAGDTDIEIEDSENPYATLPSSLATKGFTVQTYDLGEEAYTYLMGYKKTTGASGAPDVYTETPGFVLGNQAVQIVTKALTDITSKTLEWANMTCKVTRSGTLGKSGFPNLNLTFKQNIVTDASGKEVGGARWNVTKTS